MGQAGSGAAGQRGRQPDLLSVGHTMSKHVRDLATPWPSVKAHTRRGEGGRGRGRNSRLKWKWRNKKHSRQTEKEREREVEGGETVREEKAGRGRGGGGSGTVIVAASWTVGQRINGQHAVHVGAMAATSVAAAAEAACHQP